MKVGNLWCFWEAVILHQKGGCVWPRRSGLELLGMIGMMTEYIRHEYALTYRV